MSKVGDAVREVIDDIVARLRIDLPAVAAKPSRGAGKQVSDDKAKHVLGLFRTGRLFTSRFPCGLRAVR